MLLVQPRKCCADTASCWGKRDTRLHQLLSLMKQREAAFVAVYEHYVGDMDTVSPSSAQSLEKDGSGIRNQSVLSPWKCSSSGKSHNGLTHRASSRPLMSWHPFTSSPWGWEDPWPARVTSLDRGRNRCLFTLTVDSST